jgi:methyl-accepting chemotaxis protein
MGEIVGSVKRVSDVIGEITVASGEQSDGIGQVNTAVTQLDQMTQQNAALVEQSAAAAESLKDQAMRLAQVVATFRLAGGSAATPMQPAVVARQAIAKARTSVPAPTPAAAKPAARPAPQTAPTALAQNSAAGGDWETF